MCVDHLVAHMDSLGGDPRHWSQPLLVCQMNFVLGIVGSRLLHSPSLRAVGLVIEIWNMVSNWLVSFVVTGWFKYRFKKASAVKYMWAHVICENCHCFSKVTDSPLAQPWCEGCARDCERVYDGLEVMVISGPSHMTSQFKDIVTHTQKLKAVKCIFCSVWIQNFVWISKVPFEISHKFWTHTLHNMHFTKC